MRQERKGKRNLIIVVSALFFVFACGFFALLIRQPLSGTVYPNTLSAGGLEYNSAPVVYLRGHDYTTVAFQVSQQVAWQTQDTPEEIKSFFSATGWQTFEIQGSDPTHFFNMPTSVMEIGPLSIQRAGQVWVNHDTQQQEAVGSTESEIIVFITFDGRSFRR